MPKEWPACNAFSTQPRRAFLIAGISERRGIEELVRTVAGNEDTGEQVAAATPEPAPPKAPVLRLQFDETLAEVVAFLEEATAAAAGGPC